MISLLSLSSESVSTTALYAVHVFHLKPTQLVWYGVVLRVNITVLLANFYADSYSSCPQLGLQLEFLNLY